MHDGGEYGAFNIGEALGRLVAGYKIVTNLKEEQME